jgi:hypothetical protein
MSTEPVSQIEEYALKIVADYAEGGVEDDMDEDGAFRNGDDYSDTDYDAAINLAHSIINGMRANPAKVLELAKLDPSAALPAEAGDRP